MAFECIAQMQPSACHYQVCFAFVAVAFKCIAQMQPGRQRNSPVRHAVAMAFKCIAQMQQLGFARNFALSVSQWLLSASHRCNYGETIWKSSGLWSQWLLSASHRCNLHTRSIGRIRTGSQWLLSASHRCNIHSQGILRFKNQHCTQLGTSACLLHGRDPRYFRSSKQTAGQRRHRPQAEALAGGAHRYRPEGG